MAEPTWTCSRCLKPRQTRAIRLRTRAATVALEGANGLCGACYAADRRARHAAEHRARQAPAPPAAPATGRLALKASDSGYGPYGVVPLSVAS